MSLTLGSRLGPYEVAAQIGTGGMGEVYRATDTNLGRQVAIKVLPDTFAHDPERLARFEREAKTLAALNHPNIAQIYGLEKSDGIRALVMELVEGPTLADRVAQGPIPVDEALPIAKQIAEALEAAHEQNIIHRDLKPANIKLRRDGTVKVLDFGLAKAMEPAAPGSSAGHAATDSPTLSLAATRAGVILGTAAYMSPEQARGKPVDRRVDIWAFGVVLYEMLTGRPVFEGGTVSDTVALVLTRDLDWTTLPDDTPTAIRHLLLRCLERDARRRLRDIGEARVALEGAPHGATAREGATGDGWHPRWGYLGWIAAAVLLVVAVVFGVATLGPGDDDALIVRFPLAPPDGIVVAPGPAAPQLAVSPNGRHLAFAAVDASGVSQLWVRDLDSTTARPLAGTGDGQYPFWSPDSRFIGFETRTQVKTVALAGGPPRTLCELDTSNGATWSSAGVVLFAQTDGLYQVAADGGVPKRVTVLVESRQELAHYWPQFLPDGRHFLYFARSPDEEHQGIYVASLDGAEPRLLLRTVARAVHAAGYLLFLRGATLMAQPFDAARLQLTGTPSQIAENVTYNPGTNRAGFSAAGSVLALRTGGIGGTPTSELVWFDRSGNRLAALATPGAYGNIALSPDDTRVAFERIDSRTGTNDIWIHDSTQGIESQLTFNEANDGAPVFSPDGTRLVFSSDRNREFGLYVRDASGAGAVELLLAMTVEPRPTDWSASGHLVFELFKNEPVVIRSESDLLAVASRGGRKAIPLLDSEASEGDGRISPDGRWLAYVSDFSGRSEVYVAPFPPVGESGRRRISTDGGMDPLWRGNGKELFYLDLQNRLLAVGVDGDGPAFRHEAPVPLFQPNVTSFKFVLRNSYVATRDGQRFLVNVQEPGTTPVTVVVNWLAEVGQR